MLWQFIKGIFSAEAVKPRRLFSTKLFLDWFLVLLILSLKCGTVSSQVQESEDHERVLQYLHEASKLTEDVAYQFEGQYSASLAPNDPTLKLFRGIVARSKVKDFEYYSLVISQIPTSQDNTGMSLLIYQELLRIGSSRFRKNYAIPAEKSTLKDLGIKNFQGPVPELLGLDAKGNPVPSEIPRFCAFGFPFATPNRVFSDTLDVNLCLDTFLTRLVGKSVSVVNDRVETSWGSPNKFAVTTVVLDPLFEYRPTEYRVNLIRKNGLVDKSPLYKTNTSWVRIEDVGFFPSKIVMSEHSKAADKEVEVSITWLDRNLWSQIGSKNELKELVERRGTAWQDYFEEKFSKPVKR